MNKMKRKLRALLLVCAVATLWGCSLDPVFTRPDPKLTTRFAGAEALKARDSAGPAPALDEWWRGFEDPVLNEIVQKAAAENLDLAAAMARVEQARAVAAQAGAARLPETDLDANAVALRQSLDSPIGELARRTPNYDRNLRLEQWGIGATWEADLFGALRSNEKVAREQYEAAQAAGTGVRISVVAEAADAYFQVRGAQRRILVALDQISTQRKLLDLVRDRFSSGLATNRELAQANALLLQSLTTVPPLRAEQARQLNRLDVLLGAQPGTYSTSLLEASQEYSVPAISADLTPEEMLRRRPDVIAAEHHLAASNSAIGVAKAEYYPKLTLAGIFGGESLHGAVFSGDALQPQAVIGLHWRLFDFGRVDAEVAQARGAYAQSLAEYRRVMLRATEEVESSIVTLTELERQRADLQREISEDQKARDAAQDAYQGGAVSLIEVLDEDRRLLAARDSLAQLDADDARAAVAVFRALGGGWTPAQSAKGQRSEPMASDSRSLRSPKA